MVQAQPINLWTNRIWEQRQLGTEVFSTKTGGPRSYSTSNDNRTNRFKLGGCWQFHTRHEIPEYYVDITPAIAAKRAEYYVRIAPTIAAQWRQDAAISHYNRRYQKPVSAGQPANFPVELRNTSSVPFWSITK